MWGLLLSHGHIGQALMTALRDRANPSALTRRQSCPRQSPTIQGQSRAPGDPHDLETLGGGLAAAAGLGRELHHLAAAAAGHRRQPVRHGTATVEIPLMSV